MKGQRGRTCAAACRAVLAGAIVALCACSSAASDIRPGYSVPTRTLEAAFKVALKERVSSANGCYPSPRATAEVIREVAGLRTSVARNFKSVRRTGVVHVLERGASCNLVRMAYRHKGIFVLNSATGTVLKKGRHEDNTSPGRSGPLTGVTLATRSFELSHPDDAERFLAHCPDGKLPLGGGMTSNPPLGADGEGAYPHSYERLGAQRGWHISAILVDPDRSTTTARRVTVQAVCGRGLVPGRPTPRRTVFVRPGETGTAVARCPQGQQVFSGGFQRTDFGSFGGNYVTESRAIGSTAWRVTGHAFGDFGGELTAIAHCVRSETPVVTEVSASSPLPAGQSARATTPPCPPGRRLIAGGFSANGSQRTLFTDGTFNADGTWSATGYGYFGPAPSLTAYGYCMRVGR